MKLLEPHDVVVNEVARRLDAAGCTTAAALLRQTPLLHGTHRAHLFNELGEFPAALAPAVLMLRARETWEAAAALVRLDGAEVLPWDYIVALARAQGGEVEPPKPSDVPDTVTRGRAGEVLGQLGTSLDALLADAEQLASAGDLMLGYGLAPGACYAWSSAAVLFDRAAETVAQLLTKIPSTVPAHARAQLRESVGELRAGMNAAKARANVLRKQCVDVRAPEVIL